jgi:hypothetical protein
LNGVAAFSADYGTARDRFQEAVSRLGIPVESHVIAAKGPQGESLSIDVATVGPPRCRQVVILSSGLHGVEGFLGSAVQLAWLSRLGSTAELPQSVKVILVHALNPFGFAWLRRWNESNVDLNRNFLNDSTFLSGQEYRESLEAYDRLFSFLNPARPPSPWDLYTLKAIWRILAAGWSARKRLAAGQRPSIFSLNAIKNLGLAELQKTLPVGQYQHKNGLFYGGDGPEDTTAWLQEQLPTWVDGADLTLHIDFHTGLGKWVDYKLLIVDQKGSSRAEWVTERFGRDAVEAWDDRTAYNANGTMAGWFRDRVAGGLYHCLTAEFGTYPGIRVLGALRAENQAHFHADPSSTNYQWAKKQVLEAFIPAAAAWREAVIEKSLTVVARALDVCSKSAPEQIVGTAEPIAAPDPARM